MATTKAPPSSTALSSNEALVDLLNERAVDLLRLEAGTRDKLVVLLDDVEREIVASIAKIDPSAPSRVADQRRRLGKLLEAVRATIRATYRTADVMLSREIRELIDVEATWTGNAINSAIHLEWADAGVTRQVLDTLASDVMVQGAPTKEWWGRQAAGLADRFTDQMRQGVLLGEPLSKLVDRVRGTPTQPGIMQAARTSVERLVRSSVQTAANVAREQVYRDNDDIIVGLEWHATLDTRTSITCVTRDKHLYSNDDDHKPKDGGPPWLQGPGKIHWCCRSTSVPRLKTWRELGINEDEVPHTTRASMDGQVPHDQSYEDWLSKQSDARQNTVLGAEKAALWRDGKISFRDMLDQSGRPLTTEQLRAKAAKK